MDAWKPNLTMKQKICATLCKVAQYLAMVAIMEAMIILFFVMA